MHRLKKQLQISPAFSEDKLLNLTLKVNNNNIFFGKVFVMAGQTSVVIDLTDILANYSYKGMRSIQPEYNYNADKYEMPSAAYSNLTTNFNSWKQDLKVSVNYHLRLPNSTTVVSGNWDNLLLTNDRVDSARYGNSKITFRVADSATLIPRWPALQGFRIYHNVWQGYTGSQSIVIYKRLNNGTFGAVQTHAGVAKGNVILSSAANYYNSVLSLNDHYIYGLDNNSYKKIGYIDACPYPYYLVWLDRRGAIQCQPFTGRSLRTNTLTKNDKVSIDDVTTVANSYTTDSWKLKSLNLSNEEYEEMMEVLQSPFIWLWDTENRVTHLVNMQSTNIEEKTWESNKKKPIYMEIQVKAAEIGDFYC